MSMGMGTTVSGSGRVAEGWSKLPVPSFLVSEMSFVHLRLISSVSHDVIISWYVVRIHMTLVRLILFLSPSTVPFLSL
jgi:hypothetical protein